MLAVGAVAACAAMALSSTVTAETAPTNHFCYSSRRSSGQSLTDRNCRVSPTYGSGFDPPLSAVTLYWSDGYQTNIRITGGHESVGRTTGIFFGRATVDGEDSDFIELSDGMLCFIVVENGNEICYK